MILKLARNTLLYAIAPQIPKLINLFLLPLYITKLTIEDFGIYGIVLAYTAALTGLKELGLVNNMVNAFVNYPNRWSFLWRKFWGILLVWSVFFTIIQALILYYVIPSSTGFNKIIIILLFTILSLLIDVPALFAYRYFQLLQNALYIAFVTTVSGITSVLTNFLCIYLWGMGYMSWFYAIFLSSACSFLMYAIPFFRKTRLMPSIRMSYKFIRRKLRTALPIVPHNYSVYLYTSSDRIMLERYKVSVNDIGQYNFSYLFGSYFELLASAYGMAASPLHLKLFAKGTQQAHDTVRDLSFLVQFLFFWAAIITCLWIKEVLMLITNKPEFQSCYKYIVIIVMSYACYPMYFPGINLIIYHEKTDILWKITFIGGLLNVVINFIFIPYYGIMAAIFGTYISLLYVVFSGYYLKQYKELNKSSYYPWIWIWSFVTCSLLMYWVCDWPYMFKIIVSLSLTVFMSLLLIPLNKKVKTALQNI